MLTQFGPMAILAGFAAIAVLGHVLLMSALLPSARTQRIRKPPRR